MFVSGEATILHADLDAFFASVEQRDDQRLRGRPVIVGVGVVLAASYEAKAHGIHSAMGGAKARRLCPQAIVVEPRMSAYAEASKAVYRVFDDTTPLVEGLSIDEAFLDVRGLRRLAGTPAKIAGQLKRNILEQVGLPITVGVARTKFLAKVASGVAKPDGLLVVPPGGELAFLHPLAVERLWGVGPVTAKKLRSRGSPRSARSHSLRSRRSFLCSAERPAGTSMPSPTIAMRGLCRGAAAEARSGRSVRSAARRRRPARSTPSSWRWSTASPTACGPRGGSVVRSCSGCASVTTRGRRGRTPSLTQPPTRRPSSSRREGCSPPRCR